MTATSPVSPGRPASPDSSGLQRNPQDSRAPTTGTFAPMVTWAAVASALSAIAGALAHVARAKHEYQRDKARQNSGKHGALRISTIPKHHGARDKSDHAKRSRRPPRL